MVLKRAPFFVVPFALRSLLPLLPPWLLLASLLLLFVPLLLVASSPAGAAVCFLRFFFCASTLLTLRWSSGTLGFTMLLGEEMASMPRRDRRQGIGARQGRLGGDFQLTSCMKQIHSFRFAHPANFYNTISTRFCG